MTDEHRQAEQLSRHLESRGIGDARVLDAIAHIPRHLFVPDDVRHMAYDDNALPIGSGQTISQPFIVAMMTQALELTGGETVLEVGTGSGYQAAVLSRLCREVITIERIAELSRHAQLILTGLGITNIEFHIGDGTLGCAGRAPYDGIIVTAASPSIPKALYNQLKPGGKLIVPVGDEQLQTLTIVEKQETQPLVRDLGGCRFVKLIGEAGWPDE